MTSRSMRTVCEQTVSKGPRWQCRGLMMGHISDAPVFKLCFRSSEPVRGRLRPGRPRRPSSPWTTVVRRLLLSLPLSVAPSNGLSHWGKITLLIVSKRHPTGLPLRDRGGSAVQRLRRNAVGSRRQSTHSWPLSRAQPASLPEVALRVSAAPGLGTGAQKRPNRTMAGTWGRSP